MKYITLITLFCLQACWFPGNDLATFRQALDESNASDVEKRGLWDGCMIANTREWGPTSVRDLSNISIDADYASSGEYKNAFSFGFYYCHTGKQFFSANYTRTSKNLIGFKGDKIAYKAEM